MSTDEVRTVSSTGGMKGVKTARPELIPADSLWELAEHFGKGTAKYPSADGLDNWRRGYEWSKSFGAMLRHANLALGGEDLDPETGSKHLIAVAWHALVLAHWMNDPERQRFDDRQSTLERKAAESAKQDAEERAFWDTLGRAMGERMDTLVTTALDTPTPFFECYESEDGEEILRSTGTEARARDALLHKAAAHPKTPDPAGVTSSPPRVGPQRNDGTNHD